VYCSVSYGIEKQPISVRQKARMIAVLVFMCFSFALRNELNL
jgi:hypothetical protein